MEIKFRGLLLEEYCKTLFPLIDSFWKAISNMDVDINWLGKVRTHLNKIKKE